MALQIDLQLAYHVSNKFETPIGKTYKVWYEKYILSLFPKKRFFTESSIVDVNLMLAIFLELTTDSILPTSVKAKHTLAIIYAVLKRIRFNFK